MSKPIKIILLMLLMFIYMTSCSFAVEPIKTDKVYYNEKYYDINLDSFDNFTLNKYFFYRFGSSGSVYLILSDNASFLVDNGIINISGECLQFLYNSDKDVFEYNKTLSSNSHVGNEYFHANIISSNFDVKDSNGNIVFNKTIELAESNTNISALVSKISLDGVMNEVVGLLPVVVLFFVSVISIKKGLYFLKIQLIRS